MRSTWLAICLLATSSPTSAETTSPGPWAQADLAVQRLDPARFPGLPRVIRSELQRRGCTVPQPSRGGALQNVIHGHFERGAREDWAVLCSRGRTSAILVFWDGGLKGLAEFAARADASVLQAGTSGHIEFARVIDVSSPGSIRQHHERYGGVAPRRLSHSGIEDRFLGKASVIWYRDGGEWLQLQGAD
jgi:hypothetical protein